MQHPVINHRRWLWLPIIALLAVLGACGGSSGGRGDVKPDMSVDDCYYNKKEYHALCPNAPVLWQE